MLKFLPAIWMFLDNFQAYKNVEKCRSNRLLRVLPLNLSSHGSKHKKIVGFSLFPWYWLGFLIGNFLENKKWQKFEFLTPKGVYIGLLVKLSDLSLNWVWVT